MSPASEPAANGCLAHAWKTAASILSGEGAFVVGGAVRDLLLGRPCADLDLALETDPLAAGRRLADALNGSFFVLHDEDGTCRVVFSWQAERGQVDLTRLRGRLEEDLRGRDFTLNALALPLAPLIRLPTPSEVRVAALDPTGGLADLAAGCLRCTAAQALDADPLRLLRGVRLAATLGFRLERRTRAGIRTRAGTLARISAERVRDEIFALLSRPDAVRWVRELESLQLLSVALPAAANLEARDPGLLGLRRLSRLLFGEPPWMGSLGAAVCRRAQEEISPPRSRASLLHFAWLAAGARADIGCGAWRDEDPLIGEGMPPADPRPAVERARPASRALRLSAREVGLVAGMVGWAPRAGEIASARPGGAPSRELLQHRLLRDAGDSAPEALLFWLAGHAGRAPRLWAGRLLAAALDRASTGPPEPLIPAVALMAALDLPPGPAVGRLLLAIDEARADGLVRNGAEALAWARRFLQNRSGL